MAIRLGYDSVATSHQASERLIDKDRQGLFLFPVSSTCLVYTHEGLHTMHTTGVRRGRWTQSPWRRPGQGLGRGSARCRGSSGASSPPASSSSSPGSRWRWTSRRLQRSCSARRRPPSRAPTTCWPCSPCQSASSSRHAVGPLLHTFWVLQRCCPALLLHARACPAFHAHRVCFFHYPATRPWHPGIQSYSRRA